MKTEEWLRLLAARSDRLVIERFGHSKVASGWNLVDRKVPQHYLTYVLQESNTAILDGRHYTLPPHSLVYVCADYPHSMRPRIAQHPHVFYHLRFELLQNRKNVCPECNFKVIPRAQFLLPLLEQMYSEYHHPVQYSPQRLSSLLAAVMCSVLRDNSAQTQQQVPQLNPAQQRLCMDYVLQNLHREIHPAELAECTGYSTDYFSRLFKQTTGLSPRSWIMRQRIKQAAFLLESTGLPVWQIAHLCGCGDVYRFSKQFKQVCGMSPSHYRKSGKVKTAK